MKLNILMGSLVLGASLCTPSFGGGLLDRMLGMKGSGCDSACCDTGCSADPSCGCEVSASACGGCETACAPACKSGGLFGCLKKKGCDSGCAAAPSCGCEVASPCGSDCGAAPSCGCEMASSCGGGCEAAPSCGCEMSACDPCGSTCKPRRRPLMELIGKMESAKRSMFHKKGCDSCGGCAEAPSCGCEIASCESSGCGAAPSCGCETSVCGSDCGAAPSCGCETAVCDPCGSSCDSGCGKKKCGGLLGKLFKKKSSCCDAIVSCDTGCSSCGGSSMSYGSPAPVAAPIVHGDSAPMPPAPIVDPSAYLQSNRRVIQATSYVR